MISQMCEIENVIRADLLLDQLHLHEGVAVGCKSLLSRSKIQSQNVSIVLGSSASFAFGIKK